MYGTEARIARSKMYAPIVLFVYNRLWHTQQTVEALQKNELAAKSELIIYSDGPKTDADTAKVNAVREYIRTINGFRSVKINESPVNKGLANSIIDGVTAIVNQYGKIIVLEDDLVTSSGFLKFMNDALDVYLEDDAVISIHAYCYPVSGKLPETYFLKGADCWGWATWQRGWKLFEKDAALLYKKLQEKSLLKKFDFDYCAKYVQMLRDNIADKNDSWAIRWNASAFIHDKYTLYPGQSLVNNIGNDSSGTHCGCDNNFTVGNLCPSVEVKKEKVKECLPAYKKFRKFYKRLYKRGTSLSDWFNRGLIKSFLPPIALDIKRRIFPYKEQNKEPKQNNLFCGNYPSWEAALKDSVGYDSGLIFEKVKNAVMAVKEDRATYERDSVLFYEEDYNWPLLAMLLKIAMENDGKLSVLDFGGSLGSTFFQNRKMLTGLDLQWSIIEQKHFAEFGRANLADNNLHFFNDTNEFNRNHGQANVILLSSVLPYLESPNTIIKELCKGGIPYLIIDRTPFLSTGNTDRLTVQHVPEQIYRATYPAWFFNRENLISFLNNNNYRFLISFDVITDGVVSLDNPVQQGIYKGMVFKRS